jgi:plastocyanin
VRASTGVLVALAAVGLAAAPAAGLAAGAPGTKGAPIKASVAGGFKPGTIRVKPGAIVYFKNLDGAPHNAVALKKVGGKPAFSSGSPTSGSFKFKAPRTAGTYSFQCTTHFFKGKLIVKR